MAIKSNLKMKMNGRTNQSVSINKLINQWIKTDLKMETKSGIMR